MIDCTLLRGPLTFQGFVIQVHSQAVSRTEMEVGLVFGFRGEAHSLLVRCDYSEVPHDPRHREWVAFALTMEVGDLFTLTISAEQSITLVPRSITLVPRQEPAPTLPEVQPCQNHARPAGWYARVEQTLEQLTSGLDMLADLNLRASPPQTALTPCLPPHAKHLIENGVMGEAAYRGAQMLADFMMGPLGLQAEGTRLRTELSGEAGTISERTAWAANFATDFAAMVRAIDTRKSRPPATVPTPTPAEREGIDMLLRAVLSEIRSHHEACLAGGGCELGGLHTAADMICRSLGEPLTEWGAGGD